MSDADGEQPKAPDQLPDLGRSLTGWQSGQAAPQATKYR